MSVDIIPYPTHKMNYFYLIIKAVLSSFLSIIVNKKTIFLPFLSILHICKNPHYHFYNPKILSKDFLFA